ncbi:MAG: response regulator [Bacteroidota bacterium]
MIKKILVVDDAEDIVGLLTILLTKNNFEVETAYSNKTLLDKMHTFFPDLILLDVNLNGENGRDICKQIKDTGNKAPIILMSANHELLANHEECKACDVIEKPFLLDKVLSKINALL